MWSPKQFRDIPSLPYRTHSFRVALPILIPKIHTYGYFNPPTTSSTFHLLPTSSTTKGHTYSLPILSSFPLLASVGASFYALVYTALAYSSEEGFFSRKRRIIIPPIPRPGCCHAQFALASDRTSDSWVQLYMKSFRKRTMGCFERLGSFRHGFRRIGAALTRSRQSNRPLNIVSDASLYSKQGHIQG